MLSWAAETPSPPLEMNRPSTSRHSAPARFVTPPAAAIAAVALGACASPEANDRAAPSRAIVTEEITYQIDEAELTGFFARPEEVEDDVPGVLVVHEWWGHNDYARRRVRELAELGYVAFALDMYGDGRTAEHPRDAAAFMTALMQNRETLEGRFRAGLAQLTAHPNVDGEKLAAIGYCMGGGIVLDMARQGAELDVVASFHGSLGSEIEPVPGGFDGTVLVYTGSEDPMAPEEAVDDVRADMRIAGAEEVDIVVYDGVKHGFTNPAATGIGEEYDLPLEYDASADARSWASLRAALEDAFAD